MSHRLEQQDVVTVWSMKAGVVRKDAQLTLLPASQETEPIRSNSLLSLHFFFFFLLAVPHGLWDFSSWTKD